MEENNLEKEEKIVNNNQNQIAGAIIIAGLIIAGAILLKGGSPSMVNSEGKKIEINAKVFNSCLDSGKYAKAVTDSTSLGSKAGVNGTPKLFILQGDKIVNTINGAEPTAMVKQKIDEALAGKGKTISNINLSPVSDSDFSLGSKNAPVTVIEYADFQCPFCGKFFKENEQTLLSSYIGTSGVRFIYRDYAFLGNESVLASQAARCAGEQGKFWEYHDYLFSHQNGENQGNFSALYLKSFASELKLK